jgi:hypothetical protein
MLAHVAIGIMPRIASDGHLDEDLPRLVVWPYNSESPADDGLMVWPKADDHEMIDGIPKRHARIPGSGSQEKPASAMNRATTWN